MIVQIQSAVVLALAALSVAQPTLESRAIGHFVCRDKVIHSANITAAIGQLRAFEKAAVEQPDKPRPFYPTPFGNNCKSGKCFNIVDTFKEFPVTNPVWTSGPPGTVRVIVRGKGGAFVGLTVKVAGGGTGNTVEKCETAGAYEVRKKKEAAAQAKTKTQTTPGAPTATGKGGKP